MSKPAAPASADTPPKINTSNTAAGEYLLERIRILLNRMQASTEILHKWPEAGGDSAKIHNETATELIASIRKIVLAIRTIERHVNGTSQNETTTPAGIIPKEALEAFRKSLDTKCPIPLDLLDLLDVGAIFGMNPQLYARGLLKECLRQLSGLERRKRGLCMLADAIEKGMGKGGDVNDADAKLVTLKKEEYDDVRSKQGDGGSDVNRDSNKRKRDEREDGCEPAVKKERLEIEP